ncbi:MAG: hypothetical protein VX777_01950 [Chlamydiota bacterium]|nr:hypothetical protein [Chlamydiota bacterium]
MNQVQTILPYMTSAIRSVELPIESENRIDEVKEAALMCYFATIKCIVTDKKFLADPKKFVEEWNTKWLSSGECNFSDLSVQVENTALNAFNYYVDFYLEKTKLFACHLDEYVSDDDDRMKNDELQKVKEIIFCHEFLENPVEFLNVHSQTSLGYEKGDRIDSIISTIVNFSIMKYGKRPDRI